MAKREVRRRRPTPVGNTRGQPAGDRSDQSVVKRGGIAKSEAEMSDVSRDTYGTPIGPGGTANPTAEQPHEDERESGRTKRS
jgi:archaemetzincin